ncbi:MAG TPA: S1/P1 nuclease, partial [Polyangiaceae bacterium]
YAALADAATWPDTYARRHREYDAMKPFHFVNVAATENAYVRARDCPSGCVVMALEQWITLLGRHDPAPSADERRGYIYWIAHLVGDIHQPLHVAHPDGKGGNVTRLTFFDEGEQKSAHWLWDVGLIERRPVAGADGDYDAYARARWPIVAEQLLKAGVRLAAILDRALGMAGPR